MSQHWRGHWTDDTFVPKRLRNWEVPKWYPSWPVTHCVTTKFIANDRGHIIDTAKKVKHSSRGTFKGTWDLPKKITRSIAEELSMPPQYKKDLWEMHKKKHQSLCMKIRSANKNKKKKAIEPLKYNDKESEKSQNNHIHANNDKKGEKKEANLYSSVKLTL